MRFLVDACVDVAVNRWLREQGHESIHLREQRLQRLPDEDVFAKADGEARIIVTIDLDFGEILSFSGGKIVSTITFRVHNTRGSFLIARLDAVLPKVISYLERGAIVIIEDARYRVRPLPLTTAERPTP
jgi:predicted nuclease of predicted toxin-antitoxin system